MSMEVVLIIWFLATLAVLIASSLSVLVLWPNRRKLVVGYQWLFWAGLMLASSVIAGVILLTTMGIIPSSSPWIRVSFVLGQVVIAPLAVAYSLALIGKMPAGPVRVLFGEEKEAGDG